MNNGRRIVVTAGAGGIGLTIARAFVANGDRVHVCDVNEASLQRATQAGAITGSLCDISHRPSVDAFIVEAVAALGGIDVLINNAGIAGPTTSVEDLDPLDWDTALAVNLTGAFDVTRVALPHLRKSAAGVILMMSSVGGRFGYANRSTYATTKRAMIALAETLALELGRDNIRVNTIAPGAVDGPRWQAVLQARANASGVSLEEATDRALDIQSIRRFTDPEDVAAMAVYLASDNARTITGQTIAIDGGAKAPQ